MGEIQRTSIEAWPSPLSTAILYNLSQKTQGHSLWKKQSYFVQHQYIVLEFICTIQSITQANKYDLSCLRHVDIWIYSINEDELDGFHWKENRHLNLSWRELKLIWIYLGA
jgi:hypothetical protein